MGFGVDFVSPFTLRFAGTRDVVGGGGAGAIEDCRELGAGEGSGFKVGTVCREGLRGLETMGVGVGCGFGVGVGSGAALDKILENAIGSAGLLGVY